MVHEIKTEQCHFACNVLNEVDFKVSFTDGSIKAPLHQNTFGKLISESVFPKVFSWCKLHYLWKKLSKVSSEHVLLRISSQWRITTCYCCLLLTERLLGKYPCDQDRVLIIVCGNWRRRDRNVPLICSTKGACTRSKNATNAMHGLA